MKLKVEEEKITKKEKKLQDKDKSQQVIQKLWIYETLKNL